MKKIYLFGLSCLISGVGFSQSKTQPLKLQEMKSSKAGISQVYSSYFNDKNFATKGLTEFWSNDFSNPSDWNTSNTGSPSADWVIGTAGPTGTYSSPVGIINSTSGGNFAMFDSDALGSSGAVQDAVLAYGSSIDCSTKSNVRMSYEYNMASFQEVLYVEVSNNGVDYTQYLVHDDVTVNTSDEGVQELDISAVADGQSTVFIRFRYTGSWDFVWQVDDVKLGEVSGLDGSITTLPIEPKQYISNLISQVGTDYTLSAEVKNVAADPISAAFVETAIPGVSFSQNSVTSTTLNSNESEVIEVSFDGSGLGGPGLLQVVNTLSLTQGGTDEDLTNNSDTLAWLFSDSILAFAPGINSAYSADSINSINLFELTNSDFVTSGFATMQIPSEAVGSNLEFAIWSTTVTDSTVSFDNVIVESIPYTITSEDTSAGNLLQQIDFDFPDTELMPGSYAVSYFDEAPGVTNVAIFNGLDYGVSIASIGSGSLSYVEATFDLNLIFGIEDLSISNNTLTSFEELTVYPNPTTDFINVELALENNSQVTFELYNMVGQIVETKSFNSSNIVTSFDVSNLAAGMYTVKTITSEGFSVNKVEVK